MFGYRPFLLFPNLKSLQHSTQQLFSFFYIKMWIMNIYVFKNVIKRLALQAVKMGIFDLRLCSVRRWLMLANASASAGKDLGWIIQSQERTIHTRWGGSGGAGHLPGKTGALDGLGALLDFVLVAAAVQRHHLTGARPDGVRCRRRDTKDRWGIFICNHIPKELPLSSPPSFIHDLSHFDIVQLWEKLLQKVDYWFPWKSSFILWILNWSFHMK